MKKLLWSIVLIVVLVIVIALVTMQQPIAVVPAPVTVVPAPIFATPSSAIVLATDISWSYQGAKEVGGVPQTAVTLAVKGHSYGIGTYDGSCSPISSLLPGEISGTLCYFAGGGTELGIFSENGKVVLKKGTSDEGTEESGPFRGNFQTVQEIPIS